jgi:adenine phosphoribosyltransferase
MSWNTDTLEIHTDAIRKGDRVLIHDDVLTWRNRANSMQLVEELGGEIVQLNFLMDSVSLTEGKKLRDMMFFGNDVLTYRPWSHNSGSQ